MNRRIAKGGSVIALTLALGAAALSGGIAHAERDSGTGTDSTTAAKAEGGMLAADTSPAKADKADKYWTKARMKSAKSLDNVLGKAELDRLAKESAKVEAGTPTAITGEAPASDSGATGLTGATEAQCEPLLETTSSSRYFGCQTHYATQGKLYFHDPKAPEDKDNFVCSGTVVTAGNKSTVLTAGHCVKNTNKGWYDMHVFVPAFDKGEAPYGKWTGRQVATTDRWGSYSSPQWNYDVGFVVVNTNAEGATLQDTVGSTGIAFSQDRRLHVHAFGYPQAAPYDGQEPFYCAGTMTVSSDYNTNGLACKMTGGSSGGGWVIQLDVDKGTGFLNSVNSYKNIFNSGRMYGPYFGSAIEKTYQLAAAS